MINFFVSLLAKVMVPASLIFICVFFGVSISIIWLIELLRRDKLPEPMRMIFKIFFLGMVITVPVFVIEFGALKAIKWLNFSSFWTFLIYGFFAIALVEEVFKYLVVKISVLKSKEFDEPVDTMIYMATAALGFAALENILYLFPPIGQALPFNELFINTVKISFFRFAGTTFLHALCSGLVGYFLALSICRAKKKRSIMFLGLLIATLLHGLYNFSIIEIEDPLNLAIPIMILTGLAIFVTSGFRKLKKIKSVCRI
ncbi:PrsW family intramembrane metalloprotease [Patescibacteria group bacterium]|nr:PrsW family intramembrane metalloprotease [Patescibacteria group bacterium]